MSDELDKLVNEHMRLVFDTIAKKYTGTKFDKCPEPVKLDIYKKILKLVTDTYDQAEYVKEVNNDG